MDRILLKDIPEFAKVSMDFYFVNGSGLKRDALMFAKYDQIFTFEISTRKISTVYKYS